MGLAEAELLPVHSPLCWLMVPPCLKLQLVLRSCLAGSLRKWVGSALQHLAAGQGDKRATVMIHFLYNLLSALVRFL